MLEEMPQFPERDSLLLSKLYKTAPWIAKLHESSSAESEGKTESKSQPAPGQSLLGDKRGASVEVRATFRTSQG